MTTQKSIAIALDTAASRAKGLGLAAATSKQCWFLAGLIAKAGRDASDIGCQISNSQAVLTAKQASLYINDYLREQAA